MPASRSNRWRPAYDQTSFVLSGPELGCIKPVNAPRTFAHLIHEVLRTPWPVAALPVPKANKVHFLGAEARRRLKHPAVVSFIRILTVRPRPQLIGHDVKRRTLLRQFILLAPVGICEVDGLCEKRGLIKGNVKLQPCVVRERRFGKEAIPAARAATHRKIPCVV